MHDKHEISPNDWVSRFNHFWVEVFAITYVETKKLLRDPTELLVRSVQPILWLVIFGQVFNRFPIIQSGQISYLAFLTPGILAQSILFSAIFYGVAIIWDRDLGIMHKLLVSPANRVALVLGKAISSGLRALLQLVVIYLLAFIMNINLVLTLPAIAGVVISCLLGAAIFSTFSILIACLVKTRERFMGIGQLLSMPLFFASSAIYPISLMPHWLQIISKLNPLTYLVDIFRHLMLGIPQGGHSFINDFMILGLIFIFLLSITSRLYPRLVE